jgi:uncharacterized protein (DUF58 family)
MTPAGGPARAPVQRRYHFHAPGIVYVLVTLFLAVGAINSQNNLLFAALGLAIGGLLVSGIISGACLLGARIEREPLPHASVGRPLTVSYTVTNTNRFLPAFGLCITEVPTAGPCGWEAAFPAPRAFVPYVGPGRTVRVEATVVPRRRGRVEFGPVRGWTTFPFGLTRKSVTFEQKSTGLVRPLEIALRPAALADLSSAAPHGDGAERRPGHGQEYFALREYTPGDNPRRISWRRSARTGDLIVRQDAVPAPRRLWVVVQPILPGGQPAQGPALERAVALAAAIVRAALSAEMAVGLLAPNVLRPPRIGPRHAEALLCDLAELRGGGDLDAAPAVGRSGTCLTVSAGAPAPPMLASRGRTCFAESLESMALVAPADLAFLDAPGPAPLLTKEAAA